MEWLSENWIFVLVAVAFVVMHLFGHGGHGRHGGHAGDPRGSARKSNAHRH